MLYSGPLPLHAISPLQELEQENYSLKMKLERQQVSSNSLQQELEATQTQLEKEQAMREKRMGEVHSKKILELTLLNEDSKAEIGKLSVCWFVEMCLPTPSCSWCKMQMQSSLVRSFQVSLQMQNRKTTDKLQWNPSITTTLRQESVW